MFNIISLTMYDHNNKMYVYKFSKGLNYFKGINNSGKTEFYLFLDFMFGSSEKIMQKAWFKDSLQKATLSFHFQSNVFFFTRTNDPDENYFAEESPDLAMQVDLREYKDKLNSIFARDIQQLKDIKNFTDEELTYRTFTMFNFLGEKGQGKIQDFFDKCSDVKYSVKLNPILNFIFNNNLQEIFSIKNKIKELTREIEELIVKNQHQQFIMHKVNENMNILGTELRYTGKNIDKIKAFLANLKKMQNNTLPIKKKNIANLEVEYNAISEQIRTYKNTYSDVKQFHNDNKNRAMLIRSLAGMIEDDTFKYLLEPITDVLQDIEMSVFFSKHTITENTIKELEKNRKKIIQEIKENDARFECYTIEKKSRSIALIEEYLKEELNIDEKALSKKEKSLKDLRQRLKILQNTENIEKTQYLSRFISSLYSSAKHISQLVNEDVSLDGFNIQYFKKGNILQPIITNEDGNDSVTTSKSVNYYTGSMARHTLIQLCGYLGFLNILLNSDSSYPVIPILVIDHISKPFDTNNCEAIGEVIHKAYEKIGKSKLQIFIFDDKNAEDLNIIPDHEESLTSENKTGFNPFYTLINQ